MQVHLSYLIPAFLGTLAGSYLAVALFRAYARRRGFFDVPNDRSSHTRAVPLGGGVVLVVINVVAWVAYGYVQWKLPPPHLYALAAGGLIVAIISLADDISHVPYGYRLLSHVAGATAIIAGFGYWHTINLPLLGFIPLGPLGPIITGLWIVGLINAFNFMDGLDGMAAGQASVAGLGWLGLGLFTGTPVLVILGAVLAASSLGFLAHNWQPASIFMGDVGSTFLGYSFALLPIIGVRYDPRLILAGVLLVWPAIFDSAFTVLRRLRRGDNIFTGHREFLFHRLLACGWSHAQAASLYLTLPIIGALLAFTWEWGNHLLHATVLVAVAALCLGLWLLVRREEVRASARLELVRESLEADHAGMERVTPEAAVRQA